MSGDMFTQSKEEKPVTFGRVNLLNALNKMKQINNNNLLCSYSGQCNIDRTTNGRDLCLICIHRRTEDIPTMINEELKKNNFKS